jgi:hypothetical protein
VFFKEGQIRFLKGWCPMRLLLDVRTEPARSHAECPIALLPSKVSSNGCAYLHESDRTLRDGSIRVAPSQALRAWLRSMLSLRDALADISQQHLTKGALQTPLPNCAADRRPPNGER